MTGAEQAVDEFRDNHRTVARLRCMFGGGCTWWVETAVASVLNEAWLKHAEDHWKGRVGVVK